MYAYSENNKKKRTGKKFSLLVLLIFVISLVISVVSVKNNLTQIESPSGEGTVSEKYDKNSAENLIIEYAEKHNYSLSDYPESLVELLVRNAETKDFVLSYPSEKDKAHKVDLSKYEYTDEVPLFMQWDKRWGYMMYGDDIAGLTACGPTCLSMVAVYLLHDSKYSPDYMINWAIDNGYCVAGSGSLWTLISEGGEKLGLDITEIPLDENRALNNLEAGNPIICIMGPGDFTSKGHFIVLTGLQDGKIKINDPNSFANSEKLWTWSEISDQINDLWVLRA